MKLHSGWLATLVCLALASTAPAAEPALDNDDEKTLYALGLALSQPLINFGLTAEDVTLVQAGLRDGILANEPRVALEAYGPRIDELLRARIGVLAEKERAAGRAYLDEASREPGALKTDSGMIYFETRAGAGESPAADSTVKLHYHGSFRDGTVFDSSVEAGEPATFSLAAVAPCFAEGVQRMRIGGKGRLICPPELAYGDQGFPPQGPRLIPPGATLIFEVELIDIVLGATSEISGP